MTISDSADAQEMVQMMIEPDSLSYPAGSVPDFTVILRNNSSKPMKLCTYMLQYRLKAAMIARGVSEKAGDYELQPFHTQKWDEVRESDFQVIQPGKQISMRIELSAEHQFGFIRRHSQPPVVPVTHIIKGFPAGTYEFSTALSDQMAIYTGEDGVFDYRLEEKLINKLPGGHDAYAGLIEACCEVTFK